ncbi:MAG: hypothetical protein HYV63_17415 [Candidatus Schekmanbacteria bacterium]|nr:hypothetical protein [Candidatus Schekmanbacteria bacterium]
MPSRHNSQESLGLQAEEDVNYFSDLIEDLRAALDRSEIEIVPELARTAWWISMANG